MRETGKLVITTKYEKLTFEGTWKKLHEILERWERNLTYRDHEWL